MNDLLVIPQPARAKARKAKSRPKAARVVEAQASGDLGKLTVADLQLLCKTRGLKFTTRHTKGELKAILASGSYAPPASYAREAAARAKRKAS